MVWSSDSLYRPFCSERCRILDLGGWADGSYSIPLEDKDISKDTYDEGDAANDANHEPINKNHDNEDEEDI